MGPLALLILGALAWPASAGITPGSKELGAIWFIGDSITQSNADEDNSGSPRKALYDKLKAGGYSFTYTGHHTVNVDGLPATGSTAATNLYQYHSGVTASVIGSNTPDRVGHTQSLPGWWNGTNPTNSRLAVVKPNVILIMLGTNDVDQSMDLPNAPARLTTLINTIYAQPGVGTPTIFLASIPPNRSSSQDPANTAAFNAAIPGIVQSFTSLGKDIHFVDQFTDLDRNFASVMRWDKLHPLAAGNLLMAQRWYDAIEAQAAPEPASLALLGLGGVIMLWRRGGRSESVTPSLPRGRLPDDSRPHFRGPRRG